MHPIQQQAYDQAILQARQAMAKQLWPSAMEQLKRAHVLGQLAVRPHVYTHWLMLVVEWRRRRFGAVVGQFIRMLLGAVGSSVGKVPTGNTGDSEISMFQSLPIAPELQQIIDGKTADPTKLNSISGAISGLNDKQPVTINNNNKDTSA